MDQVVILRNMRPVAATPRRQFITLSARTVERLRVAAAVAGVLRKVWRGLHVSEILPTFAASSHSVWGDSVAQKSTSGAKRAGGVSYKFRPVRCVNAPATSDKVKTTGSGTSFVSTPTEIINKGSNI